jgi:WD40 repeat protein
MHIYFSALPFLPPRTELHRRFGHEKEGALMVKSRVKSHWAACVQSIGVDSQVYSVAVSEDGTRIAAGTESGQILVIDATTGTRIHQFQGHIDRIRSVAFSRDGKSIISSSYDQTVKFWDSMSGEERLRLSYTSHISSVAFSPDDARVVSGSGDGVVRVLDSKSGTALLTLVGHTDDISSVAFSPDGASIVSGSWDMDVRVWDNASGNPLLIMEDHTSNVSSVAFSPDGASIVSGSWDMSVRVWDSKSGRIQFILRGHRSPIYSVAFSPNGSRIVLGSEDGTVRVWDRLEGRELLTLQGHTSDVHSVAFLPDGVHIVSGSHDSTLRVWDRRFDVGQLSLRGHSGCVNSVAISPNGRLTVSGSDDRTVRVWDNTSGTELRILKAFAVVLEVSFTANGRYVEGRTNETVLRWEAGTGMKISHLDSSPEPRLTMRSLCFFENGRIVKTDTNGRIVAICHVPASYDVRNASFHGNIGALGLATGEVIILEIPV